ncbi:carbohydrate ABC transporter substrate-binding protein, CUT1 family [Natronincola peptidivorans]|uniref:Carbohydrate ABC transporter substrate-binding protein, CUT1 family n=1 Tax=Natronincola peptidivorans TaxID=426128 RepID=A0A1I0EPD2_9FIRM|nr:extracellular solute-binding protein [Natronincola peptidivorans]SET47354.1 carbohydrate ABC transporter substrate-binding protein, CUT1 family [Natronincola peptidivorans]
MRKSKKKLLGIVIYLTLFMFIIGGPFYLYYLQPKIADHNKAQIEPSWTGVISFWDFPRLDRDSGTNFRWIYEKIQDFEKENPGVYINFQTLDWEKGTVKLDTAIKMGNPPDIIPIGSDYSILGQEILEPLDTYLTEEEVEKFRENVIEAVTYNGQIWAMPWMMTTYTMVLNLDLFHERGVEPPVDGNWSYDEFVEKMQRLTYDSKGRGKADYFGFNSFVQSGYYNIWGFLLSDGAEIINKNQQYVFTDDSAQSGVEKIIDLKYKYGVTPTNFGENTSNAAWTSFYQDQNIAVYPVGTWALNVLDSLIKEGVGFEYTIANYPTGELGVPISISSGIGAYGVKKQVDDKKLQVCVNFLKYLTDDKYQMELDRLGVFPVKKTVGNIYEGNALMTMLYNNLDNTKMIPPHPYWKEIDNILQNEIRLGLLGKKTAEEILREVNQKVELLLNTIGK